ncbi:MAG: ECF-type sigma factor [Phycisphaerales bacterium]
MVRDDGHHEPADGKPGVGPAHPPVAAIAKAATHADGPFDAEAYEHLHRLARGWFGRERSGHTLQPTALLHEVWLKLGSSAPERFRDREHFLATAAMAMRQVLINHARARTAVRRGGPDRQRVSLDAAPPEASYDADVLLDLAVAIEELGRMSGRAATIAEWRLLGGLTVPQVARRLDCSVSTVEQEWRTARAWLHVRLEAAAPMAGA